MKVKIKCRDNAGKSVATRWGRVAFDASGHGEVEVAGEADLVMLTNLKWYTPEAADAQWVAPEAPKPPVLPPPLPGVAPLPPEDVYASIAIETPPPKKKR